VLATIVAGQGLGLHARSAWLQSRAAAWDVALPAKLAGPVDRVADALWTRFNPQRAMRDVRFISQYWRLAGNPGFDATIDRVHESLRAAGFRDGPRNAPPRGGASWIEEYPNTGHGWSYSVGTLAIVRSGRPDEVLLSRERQQIALCINSFSTPAGGVVAPLIDVGKGDSDAAFGGKNVRGAVVLGDAPVGTLWRLAVSARGAAGVVSTELRSFVSPVPPGRAAPPRDQWDVLQWDSVPFDDAHRAFGFKATPRAAATLRAALRVRPGQTQVRVVTQTAFSGKPARMLVAEIGGRNAARERVVLTAHVHEPGANDNASGVAMLAELARAWRQAIVAGAVPPPDRTITFLWLDEIDGSRHWLSAHPDQAARVKHMFSVDMAGEDVSRTGGSFLIERWPDPAAVWERPWDPHSEWGRGNVRPEQLTGDLINDLHAAICRRVGQKTGWVVKTNPYEGGSDHMVFGVAGIPSVLDWHFTDRYYHTNLDTPDKVSPAEMRNVGVAVGTSAWVLASSDEETALAVATLVAAAGHARVAVEREQGGALVASQGRVSQLRQAEIVATWRKWYAQAVRSASRLALSPASAPFMHQLDELAKPFEG
jgi:hypothetical protein